MTEASITLSSRAAKRIAEILASEQREGLLRISVEGGGCSGFQYKFDVVNATATDDIVVERDGARAVIDPISLDFVRGGEIDFVDDLIGAQFKVNNPNAVASCGCGTSFTI